MLPIFLQSLLTGALLTTTIFCLRLLLRRTNGQHLRRLQAGRALRCIEPLDLTDG